MTSDAFVPPNPKLFVSAALIPGILCAFRGTKFAPGGTTAGSGSVKHNVGGTYSVCSASAANAASTAPAAPNR